ncbi:hypothetical protein CFBP2533_05170 [Xanthomonas hortorum pv. pelargonii]|uniref:Uncharacterized protein n=1 Tax=Xanthomonas hortorum pv. pelargonii TaxID=453602 RepID=A0A6V7BQ56_9XANT|nr:hypothetical protein CFBP2533_05170 [Xanthomonas hortorum pv. pelargonii]CAD0304111.1 hypothetical protein CFBP2533_05170 [Xanthomonas hortorum pv. pelargonii]
MLRWEMRALVTADWQRLGRLADQPTDHPKGRQKNIRHVEMVSRTLVGGRAATPTTPGHSTHPYQAADSGEFDVNMTSK